jgi:hypothetical protein
VLQREGAPWCDAAPPVTSGDGGSFRSSLPEACAGKPRSGDRSNGTDNTNKGRGNANKGTDNANEGTDNAHEGTDNANEGTDNASEGTDNANTGTDNANKGSIIGIQVRMRVRIMRMRVRIMRMRVRIMQIGVRIMRMRVRIMRMRVRIMQIGVRIMRIRVRMLRCGGLAQLRGSSETNGADYRNKAGRPVPCARRRRAAWRGSRRGRSRATRRRPSGLRARASLGGRGTPGYPGGTPLGAPSRAASGLRARSLRERMILDPRSRGRERPSHEGTSTLFVRARAPLARG